MSIECSLCSVTFFSSKQERFPKEHLLGKLLVLDQAKPISFVLNNLSATVIYNDFSHPFPDFINTHNQFTNNTMNQLRKKIRRKFAVKKSPHATLEANAKGDATDKAIEASHDFTPYTSSREQILADVRYIKQALDKYSPEAAKPTPENEEPQPEPKRDDLGPSIEKHYFSRAAQLSKSVSPEVSHPNSSSSVACDPFDDSNVVNDPFDDTHAVIDS